MTPQPAAAPGPGFDAGANQFLSFTLGEEQYGVEILKVQEIRGYSTITPIPNTPPWIKGMMNLRGTVVPVVDLRLRFSMPAGEYNKFTVIIVVSIGRRVVGVVVDAVSDVLDIPADQIRGVPDMGARVDTRFISGIASAGERLTVLLDIERLLSDDDLAEAESLAQ